MSLFELEPDLLARLILAVVYGGLIGFEREAAGRAAGLRTVILVCLGSTLITMISVQLPSDARGDLARAIVRMDPGRISAGIVTGVGFLGGAVVVKLGDLVRGVTTAASIWLAAGLGIALGQGNYALATWTTLIALVVLTVFPFASRRIAAPVYRHVHVGLGGDAEARRGEIVDALAAMQVHVMDVFAEHEVGSGHTQLTYHVRCSEKVQGPAVVARLSGLPDVTRVRWS